MLDKPKGLTSVQCLERIKKKLKQPKLGHAGTLDPLATGVLVIGLGQGTKLTPYLMEGKKIYSGWIRLGMVTDTYDLEGDVLSEHDTGEVDLQQVEREITSWTELKHHPVPPFSAAKHKGEPHYKMARKGETPPEKSKPVHIDLAEVLDIQFPFIQFRVSCSKGTYIRSLAHSLGTRLGCGAVLAELVREESHPFTLKQAVPLQDLLHDPELFARHVLSLQEGLPHWPRIYLTSSQAAGVKNGHWLQTDNIRGLAPAGEGERALLLTNEEQPVALAETRYWGDRFYWAILRGL